MNSWHKTRLLHPPENQRVLVSHSGTSFYNPCIATYQYVTGGGGYWMYEPDFMIPGEPEFWRLVDRPEDRLEVA